MTIGRGLISVRSLPGVLSAARLRQSPRTAQASGRHLVGASMLSTGLRSLLNRTSDKTPDLEVRLKLANIRGHFSQSGQGGKHDSNATIGIRTMDRRC